MSTLRNELNFMECLLNKKDQTKMYMVLKETVHNVWVIDMEGKDEPFELPKRMINMVYMKVDPKTVKVLFSERADENINNDPQFEPDAVQTDDNQGG